MKLRGAVIEVWLPGESMPQTRNGQQTGAKGLNRDKIHREGKNVWFWWRFTIKPGPMGNDARVRRWVRRRVWRAMDSPEMIALRSGLIQGSIHLT